MFNIALKAGKFLPANVVLKGSQAAFAVRQNSPTILFGAGVVGAVASTVLACKATLKLEGILTEAEKTVNVIDTIPERPDYTLEDRAKDKRILKAKTAVAVAKLYGPAALVGLSAVAALTGSHYIMSQRQTALLAAYAVLDKGFKEYQARVREEVGVQREEELRVGSVVERMKTEDGKTIKMTRKSGNEVSIYGRFFDELNPEWRQQPEINFLTLKCKQDYANNLLRARGYLFLNEVYQMFGFDATYEGQIVGWLYDGTGESGDEYVDFGFMNPERMAVREFVNRNEASVYLDFNVDGPIIGKLPKGAQH